MAGQTDFEHITVNPAEPDDIVIHAGAPQVDTQSSEGDVETSQPASSSRSSSPAQPAANASAVKTPSAYHATTLEDIQGFKMSRTQIAIIIIALAAIAAFVVWYLVFS